MAAKSLKTIPGELVEVMSLGELCRSCGVRAEWVVELVEEGILEPEGAAPPHWQFSAISITRVRTAWHLQRDLGVNTAGIAVALNLIEEREALRHHLRRLALARKQD